MKRQEFINDIASKINRGSFSVFAGSGTSVESGLPQWKDLFSSLADELNISINDINDYYLLAQYYANKFGNEKLRTYIYDKLNIVSPSNALIDSMISLPIDTFWTTNFDKIIENSLERHRKIRPNIIFNDSELSKVQIKSRLNLFKMNGDIDNYNSTVITKENLESYILKHTTMLTFFKKELVSSTFLFLGYSFSDALVLPC